MCSVGDLSKIWSAWRPREQLLYDARWITCGQTRMFSFGASHRKACPLFGRKACSPFGRSFSMLIEFYLFF